jgi:hypothetical protein
MAWRYFQATKSSAGRSGSCPLCALGIGRLAVVLPVGPLVVLRVDLLVGARVERSASFADASAVAGSAISRGPDVTYRSGRRSLSIAISAAADRTRRDRDRPGTDDSAASRLRRRRWQLPLGGGGVVVRQRESERQRRRAGASAHSAQVVGIRREELDLDRFVAALLAMAAEPGKPAPRRRGEHPATGAAESADGRRG